MKTQFSKEDNRKQSFTSVKLPTSIKAEHLFKSMKSQDDKIYDIRLIYEKEVRTDTEIISVNLKKRRYICKRSKMAKNIPV